MLGQTLSHFEIVEKLGEGGMGVVYKARDTQLNRLVAIKVLPPDKVAHGERRKRFMQEARAASALNHPNIVTIYEIARDGEIDFIAMEFVAGKTLEQHMQRPGLKMPDALKYSVQISDALSRAHAAGIVHRDLKPGNIMIGADGVKILDFGLAKLTEVTPCDPGAATLTAANPVDSPRTEDGAIVGTAAYMAPEQAEGKAVDARADIFAFGAILYEMVTGRRAFQGANRISTLAAVMNQEPKAISEITPAVPRELEKLISRCLRKSPERRAQHMSDLKLELEELKEESESGVSQSGTAAPLLPAARQRPRWVMPALAGVALVAGGSGYWNWKSSSSPAKAEMKTVVLTSYSGFETQPALSPDGKQLAFIWNGEKEERAELYVKLVDAGAPVRLTDDPGFEQSPAWSPDGRFILFVRLGRGRESGGGYFVIPSLGGAERKVFDIPAVPSHRPWPSADWTPDGKSIVAVDTSVDPPAIVLVSLESGEKKELLKPLAGSMGDYNPLASPDGKWLALSRIKNVNVGVLMVTPMAGAGSTAPRQFIPEAIDSRAGAAWSSDSREIIYGNLRTGKLMRSPIDLSSPPALIAESGSDALFPSIARQGGRLAYAHRIYDTNLWRVSLAEKDKPSERMIASSRWEAQAEYSPDGTRVAFISERSGDAELWVANADGSNPVQLTWQRAVPTAPQWSPDGRKLVFAQRPGGNTDVYVIDAQGGAPRRMTTDPGNDASAYWSRDGKWIYFASNRTGRQEVWKIPAGGSTKEVQVTRNGGWRSTESADGRMLYFQKFDQPGLFRMPVGGGAEERVADVPALEPWEMSGGAAYYFRWDDAKRRYVVHRVDLATLKDSEALTLPEGAGGGTANFSISPDGKWLLFVKLDQSVSDLMMIEGFR